MKAGDMTADVVRRREAGESLESIAKSYGVTRERVRQILLRQEKLARRRERYRQKKLEQQ